MGHPKKMTNHRDPHDEADDRLHEASSGGKLEGITWPLRRAGWFVEKHILWPLSDSFRRVSNGFKYRSPMAYIGATMLLTLTGAAIAAAVYFHNQAEDSQTPLQAQVPTQETTVAATPTPPPALPSTPENQAKDDDTLKGVAPNFETSGKADKSNKSGSDGSGQSSDGSGSSSSLPSTVVRPSEEPSSPPLKVAHSFAQTFVEYEVGKKGVAKDFEKTATTKLTKELKADPPRQPSNGKIPKATVLNVVKGKKNGGKLDVSVSLMRSGSTSELRLALEEDKKNNWLVSEVRG
jgi:hypothetical protein